jgi:hypothetical protein
MEICPENPQPERFAFESTVQMQPLDVMQAPMGGSGEVVDPPSLAHAPPS